tara:strand:+ start:596 stop:1039 length:444 start_codon:yes stop_codon:yes gene_type:complete
MMTENTVVSSGEVAIDKIGDEIESISEEILACALTEVKEQLGAIGIKPSTLSIVIKHTMEVIENTPVKGKAQLNYALLIIRDLVNELEDSDEKTLLIQMLDNGGIKDTIELVVDASKGKLKINKVAEVVAEGFLGPCFNYITSICFK